MGQQNSENCILDISSTIMHCYTHNFGNRARIGASIYKHNFLLVFVTTGTQLPMKSGGPCILTKEYMGRYRGCMGQYQRILGHGWPKYPPTAQIPAKKL